MINKKEIREARATLDATIRDKEMDIGYSECKADRLKYERELEHLLSIKALANLYLSTKGDEGEIERIISSEVYPCPNKCKEGLVRMHIGTENEGNVICSICAGLGEIKFTNEEKAKAISNHLKMRCVRCKGGKNENHK